MYQIQKSGKNINVSGKTTGVLLKATGRIILCRRSFDRACYSRIFGNRRGQTFWMKSNPGGKYRKILWKREKYKTQFRKENAPSGIFNA
jgi:hypothetical protein